MALTRVSGRVVYPHGEDTPAPVAGDGVIEYAHASPGVIGEAVHGPDRHRIEYVDGVAGEAWLKAGMWRAYVYPSEGRSYTLHLGIPDGGDVTLADVVGEVVPDGIVTRGEQGDPGASVVGGRDNGDGTVSFELSDGTFTDPVVLPPGPAGRGIASISDPDADSRVTITYSDGTTQTVQAIAGAPGNDGHTPVIGWDGTALVIDGEVGPDLRGEPGADSTVPGPAPAVAWDGDRLVVEGVTGPSLTGPDGPAPTVAWDADRLIVGGVAGPALTGPASTVPGPPGAVPVASDYLVVGPGRPDAPTTTGFSAAQIAALPVGCEYRSTDGASVGAWVWRKRPTGWTVTQGDTDWVTLTDPDVWASGGMMFRRVDSNLYWKVGTGQYGLFRWSAAFANGVSKNIIPAPFRPQGTSAFITLRTDGASKGVVGVFEIQTTGSVVRRTTDNGTLTSDALSGPTSNPWPTTLTP